MGENNQNDERRENLKAFDIAKLILIIIIIVAIGLFSINQFIKFRYYNYVLTDPCQVCQDLNPGLEFRIKPETLNITITSNYSQPIYVIPPT